VLKGFENRIKRYNFLAHYKREHFMDVKDSNGTLLSDGDNVTLIKDLKVKGSSITLKRGTMVKGIRLYNETEVECRTDKVKGLRLETQWLKKV
jgi:protein PhnA